jgi:hypothetical protein
MHGTENIKISLFPPEGLNIQQLRCGNGVSRECKAICFCTAVST